MVAHQHKSPDAFPCSQTLFGNTLTPKTLFCAKRSFANKYIPKEDFGNEDINNPFHCTYKMTINLAQTPMLFKPGFYFFFLITDK